MLTRQTNKSDQQVIEVSLAADGNETILVWEERGMPPELLAAYGAGVQVHVEDLAAYLAGGERSDAGARFDELFQRPCVVGSLRSRFQQSRSAQKRLG